VILENVFDPHNVSAVMRTCDAVGIQEVYILNDKIAPQKKWGYRSSSTASEWLTVHQFTDIVQCFTEVKKKYEKVYSTHFTNEANDVFDLNLTESIALVFGNETLGVSDEVLRYSDGNFVVPQVGIIKSLNISVACAITLYEAFRQKRQRGQYRSPRLDAAESDSLRKKWGLNTGN
jgi:tRNA (guanosine-2'-O-)-methyltransferase